MIFTPESYWNTPTTGPAHEQSDIWMDWLRSHSAFPYPRIDATSTWGIPVYWPKATDRLYTITPSAYGQMVRVRIPSGAKPSSGSDGVLVVISVPDGWSYSLWGASFTSGVWRAKGTSAYALWSDGLCKTAPNFGHRGIPPPMQAIRLDELSAGVIARKLEVFIPGTAASAIYPPMCAFEPNRDGIIPEGAVLRVKADVNLDGLLLSSPARIVATALQRYGAVVGDNDPTRTALKAQPTLSLRADALSVLGWDRLEFAA